MIVNQTGGGSGGGDKLTKVVKTFSDVHSSSQYEHPTVHFNVSKALQPGEILIAYGYVKTYRKKYTDDVAPAGELYSGRYAVYVDGDSQTSNGRQTAYGGDNGYDTTDTGEFVKTGAIFNSKSAGELLFQPTGGYANSSGATYVSRNEIWFTKEG